MQPKLKQVGLICLFLILPIDSAPATLQAGTEALDSGKRRVRQELAGFSSEQRDSLVDGFEASPVILGRIETPRVTRDEQQTFGGKMPWYLTCSFPVMPILGFALSVLALGTLLNCHPPTAFSRPGQRHQSMYCRQVFYLVGLLVVLNLYDLACTLFARGSVGFWEMNPFAATMLDVPPRVVCFKLALTICPAILFIVGRRSKLAQIASWWGGVVYTVLILRWVTYNAMFIQ